MPSAAQVVEFAAQIADVFRKDRAAPIGTASLADEAELLEAAEADRFGNFVVDLLWVQDAELGDWIRPPVSIRDPTKALENVRKDLGHPRTRLIELVRQLAVGSRP